MLSDSFDGQQAPWRLDRHPSSMQAREGAREQPFEPANSIPITRILVSLPPCEFGKSSDESSSGERHATGSLSTYRTLSETFVDTDAGTFDLIVAPVAGFSRGWRSHLRRWD